VQRGDRRLLLAGWPRGWSRVGVSTIHSSKGLDAGHVLILNAHELDGLGDEEEARRLLYIAMTRARDELCISAARPSRIVDEVARAVQAGAGP
jgi:superfamily I DNA/RNA helicase